jgi:hypothetical protein
MATYIHKNGPDAGTIVLQDYELGLSDAFYAYTKIGATTQRIKVGYADNAGNINGHPGGDVFLKSGQNQVVNDTNVSFANRVTATEFIGNLTGTALKAKYADLAENYEADQEYEVGTVLFIGDKTEVSINGNIVAGIVSNAPGYLLNSEADYKHIACIALKGRIPVKVSEEVKRGDLLVVDRENKGFAKKDTGFVGLDILGVCINDSKDGIAEIKV